MASFAEGEAAAADARPVLDVSVYGQLLARPKARRSLGGAVGGQDRETNIQEVAARELSAIYPGITGNLADNYRPMSRYINLHRYVSPYWP